MIESGFESNIARLANMLLLHVVPLFNVRHGKRPELIGSSLLLEIEGVRYFVSARHVIDQTMQPGGLHYYIDRGRIHRLVGTVIRTSPLPGAESIDPYDVAVVRLAPEAVLPVADTWKVPLVAEAVRPVYLPRIGKQYMVVGFPSSRSKANPHNKQLKSEPSGFRIVSADTTEYEMLSLSERSHIVLSLDIERMNFPDGSVRQIADPHGMSGAPLWMLFDEIGENDPALTPVVGTIIEYHKDRKLLIATDIGVALTLIEKSAA